MSIVLILTLVIVGLVGLLLPHAVASVLDKVEHYRVSRRLYAIADAWSHRHVEVGDGYCSCGYDLLSDMIGGNDVDDPRSVNELLGLNRPWLDPVMAATSVAMPLRGWGNEDYATTEGERLSDEDIYARLTPEELEVVRDCGF